MATVRTRFAPSPTGYLHLGGLRTALYTYLYAKQNAGSFVLRIEDTDQERYVEGAVDAIYRSMRLAGLNWDEGPDIGGDYGPYVQSERKGMYLPYAQQLVEMGKAYYCFCTEARLKGLRAEYEARGETFKYDKHCANLSKEEVQARIAAGEPYVIRQNLPEQGEASFDDALFGHIAVDVSTLDDMILIKSDGMPTYNFANVIDDHTMGITHVMRGSEYLSSTPKYNLLYEAFGWEKPVYIHLSPIMANATRKLSKRYGDPSFEDLMNQGYLKDAIVNYIALLGWNPGDEREYFTLDELTQAFSLKGLSKSPAVFDMMKLRHFNFEYVQKMNTQEFEQAILPWISTVIDPARFDTHRLAELLQPRCEVLSELAERLGFLNEMPEYDLELFFNKRMKTNRETALPVLEALYPLLEQSPVWSEQALHDAVMDYVAQQGCKNGFVLWPLRIAISGWENTPAGAFEIAGLLGREETLRRLRTSMDRLKA
ncbi:MAG: glutamate--tRNA ligase [Eubacteriales bacterium]|nr:glutamate--tRNA ligase [Eubacteriales bacterium]